MFRIRILLILLLFAALASAKNDSTAIFQGCGGGMMVHAGYLLGENAGAVLPSGENISPQGMTRGLGGSMRVHLMKHLRVGCEGFSSTMKSGVTDKKDVLQSGSYVRTSWGGVIVDACWRGEKWWPYIGGSVGGGAMRNLYLVEGSEDDWTPELLSVFHKQGFGYVNVDYCVTKRIHATFRVDWMMAFAKKELILPTGPRLYVGLMFNH